MLRVDISDSEFKASPIIKTQKPGSNTFKGDRILSCNGSNKRIPVFMFKAAAISFPIITKIGYRQKLKQHHSSALNSSISFQPAKLPRYIKNNNFKLLNKLIVMALVFQ